MSKSSILLLWSSTVALSSSFGNSSGAKLKYSSSCTVVSWLSRVGNAAGLRAKELAVSDDSPHALAAGGAGWVHVLISQVLDEFRRFSSLTVVPHRLLSTRNKRHTRKILTLKIECPAIKAPFLTSELQSKVLVHLVFDKVSSVTRVCRSDLVQTE